jgi:hypothetical protein
MKIRTAKNGDFDELIDAIGEHNVTKKAHTKKICM